MAYDDYEKSVQESAPVELYTFVAPTATYRITSYHKDVVFGGNTFTAVPTSRSNLQIVDLHSDQWDASVELPASHALVQHYANRIPPRELSCLIQRYQPASGVALQFHFGYVLSLSFKGQMGSFRIPSGTADALSLDVPSVAASRLCNHVLYDARCRVVETSFDVATTVSTVSSDGRTITTVGSVPAGIASLAPINVSALAAIPWALHGRLKHVASGEERTITAQTGLNQFTIQCEFGGAGIVNGDSVVIYAGCDLTLGQCRAKFSNAINFGGIPRLPRSNIFYTGFFGTNFQK